MYEEYFKLSGQPFKLNPDPKFFYGSRSHNKAMAYLHYGLRQAEGFIVITGEIGAGKSMLISHLLDQLDRSRIAAAHLLTPNLKPDDLLSHILSSFRIEAAGQGKTAYLEAFEDFLFDQLNHGRRVLLIVDEAQNLPVETLEELRILSNMDYDGTPLFQVFLVGQPDFRPVLAGANMEQLRQRIIASYHLEPLSSEETKDYIEHRMTVVGWEDNPTFTEDAFAAIYDASEGVPRKINKLCNRILLYCSLEELHEVSGDVVRSVAADLAEENLLVTPEPAAVAPASAEKPEAKPEQKVAAAKPAPEKAKPAPPTKPARKTQKSSTDERADKTVKQDDAAKQNGAAPVVVPFETVRKVSANEAAAKKQSDEPAKVKNRAEKPQVTVKQDSDEKLSRDGGPNVTEKTKEKSPPVKAAVKTASAKATPPPADDSAMSVLDRLKAQRSEKKAAPKPKPQQKQSAAKAEPTEEVKPKPATIHDVADAIAAATANSAVKAGAKPATPQPVAVGAEEKRRDLEGAADAGDSLDAPDIHEDLKGWRQTMVQSINEARDELKLANSTVNRMRRTLKDSGRKERDRNNKVIASLTRAEKLLSEIRDIAH